MFSILRNPEASSEELAQAYIKAIALEKQLSSERKEIHQKLMELQVDSFDRKPGKEFQSLKIKMDDINIRLDACEFGREQLKARIADRLGVEAKQRLEQITKELAAVSSEEKEIRETFLSMAAKAAILQEQIKGRSLLSDGQGRVTAGVPSMKVELHLLDGIDGAFYSERIKHYRQESPAQDFSETIRGRQDDLTQERNRLEQSLSVDPMEEAERLLNRLIPPPPEPAVVAEQPKTHPDYESKVFERDYGEEISSPDYDRKRAPARGMPGSVNFPIS